MVVEGLAYVELIIGSVRRLDIVRFIVLRSLRTRTTITTTINTRPTTPPTTPPMIAPVDDDEEVGAVFATAAVQLTSVNPVRMLDAW